MRKVLFIIVSIIFLFVIEFILYQLFGRHLKLNLLLIFVIFVNLCFGIRYSLLTAFLAGFLKDSFSLHVFGMNIVSFVLCAYLTTVIKKYVYHMGSRSVRVIIVFTMCLVNFMVHYLIVSMFGSVNFLESISRVLLPELIPTVLLTTYVIQELRRCVLKLSVY